MHFYFFSGGKWGGAGAWAMRTCYWYHQCKSQIPSNRSWSRWTLRWPSRLGHWVPCPRLSLISMRSKKIWSPNLGKLRSKWSTAKSLYLNKCSGPYVNQTNKIPLTFKDPTSKGLLTCRCIDKPRTLATFCVLSTFLVWYQAELYDMPAFFPDFGRSTANNRLPGLSTARCKQETNFTTFRLSPTNTASATPNIKSKSIWQCHAVPWLMPSGIPRFPVTVHHGLTQKQKDAENRNQKYIEIYIIYKHIPCASKNCPG